MTKAIIQPHKQAFHQMNQINVGDVLTARSIGDSECIFSVQITARKGSFVTLIAQGETKRKKVELDNNGHECVYAFGKYSMAPCFKALSLS